MPLQLERCQWLCLVLLRRVGILIRARRVHVLVIRISDAQTLQKRTSVVLYVVHTNPFRELKYGLSYMRTCSGGGCEVPKLSTGRTVECVECVGARTGGGAALD